MSFSRLLLAIPLFACASCAHAVAAMEVDGASVMLADAAHGKKKREGLFGAVSIGYLATTGNTDSASLNAKTSLGYVSDPWRHALTLKAVKGSTDGVTTVEDYEAAEQSDYSFSKNNYVYGALNDSANRFAGYDRRTSEIVGYGRRVLDSDTQTLDLQIGAGRRQTRSIDGTRQNETVVQFGGSYLWNFGEHANLSQQIRVDHGDQNTFSESVTAVTANLTGDLALSVSYTVKHNSAVPLGTVKTDTATAVSVIYGF